MPIDALRILRSLGIQGDSWRRWTVFLKALFCEPLDPEELAAFHEHTGRSAPPTSPVREAYLVCGRRSGKSRVASVLVLLFAYFIAPTCRRAVGETLTVMVLAVDRKQAGVVFRYIKEAIDAVPALKSKVARETAETVELNTGVVIEVRTSSYKSVRGPTVLACIADELAFWQDETGANPASEILNAIRPATATLSTSLILGLTTPYARRGLAWEMFKQHYGQDGPILVWASDSKRMNPLIPDEFIAKEYERDPAAASAEFGGEFRRDIESFVSEETLDRCVVEGRVELPPSTSPRYSAFCDPSGGSADSFGLAIVHKENGRLVLDCIREIKAPFDPSQAVLSLAGVLKSYGIGTVRGDKYAGLWPTSEFAKHGIRYEASELDKSALYAEALPLLNAGRVELLDHRTLLAQLRTLERRTSRSGKDSIDHPPNARDDVSNAACGAIVHAGKAVKPAAGAVKGSGIGAGWRGGGNLVNWMHDY